MTRGLTSRPISGNRHRPFRHDRRVGVSWEVVAEQLKIDGSLKDIYILDTSTVEWQRLLDLIQGRGWRYEYREDGRPTTFRRGESSGTARFGEPGSGSLNEFRVLRGERFDESPFESRTQTPERSLFTGQQNRVDPIGFFPTMEELEQDQSFVCAQPH